MLFPENSLRRVHWISLMDVYVEEQRPPVQTLVLMCGFALSVIVAALAVVLPSPHDCSSAFQRGYSARFIASRRVPKGARMMM